MNSGFANQNPHQNAPSQSQPQMSVPQIQSQSVPQMAPQQLIPQMTSTSQIPQMHVVTQPSQNSMAQAQYAQTQNAQQAPFQHFQTAFAPSQNYQQAFASQQNFTQQDYQPNQQTNFPTISQSVQNQQNYGTNYPTYDQPGTNFSTVANQSTYQPQSNYPTQPPYVPPQKTQTQPTNYGSYQTQAMANSNNPTGLVGQPQGNPLSQPSNVQLVQNAPQSQSHQQQAQSHAQQQHLAAQFLPLTQQMIPQQSQMLQQPIFQNPLSNPPLQPTRNAPQMPLLAPQLPSFTSQNPIHPINPFTRGTAVAKFWTISPEDIDFGESSVLGQGTFGVVYLAHYRGTKVAVKIPKIGFEEFQKETEVMLAIRHPNIVTCLGTVQLQNGSPGIVMEYMKKGSLRSFITNNKITIAIKIQLALDMANGLSFLHAEGIFHRDLSHNNVLVSQEGFAKITDFGKSKLLTPASTVSNTLGAYLWMAPEAFQAGGYVAASDIFSYGILLWELETGNTSPFPPTIDASRLTDEYIIDWRMKGGKPPLPHKGVLSDLLINCLSSYPQPRPTAMECITYLTRLQERLETVPS